MFLHPSGHINTFLQFRILNEGSPFMLDLHIVQGTPTDDNIHLAYIIRFPEDEKNSRTTHVQRLKRIEFYSFVSCYVQQSLF